MQPVERDSLRLVVQKLIEDGAKADLWFRHDRLVASQD